MEIDLVLGDAAVDIEIKSSKVINTRHLSNFKPFREKFPQCRCIMVPRFSIFRQKGNIEVLYYKDFLKALWTGKIISTVNMFQKNTYMSWKVVE